MNNPTKSHKVKNMKTSTSLKARFSKASTSLSLKAFARELMAKGDETAKDWFDHKKGSVEKVARAERLKNKGATLAAIRSAVQANRSKLKKKN